MLLRALKYSFIAGVGFWFLLNLLVFALGYTELELARDGHKIAPLLDRILLTLMSVSLSVLMFTVVCLISVGILKAFEFVKRIIHFS